MYIDHFGLTSEPFSLSPDPAFLYLSAGHAEALAALKVGLQGGRGLIVMSGEVGTGKTTLLYTLLAQLGSEVRTAYVSNTKLSFDEVLRQALADFGVSCDSHDHVELLRALNAFLVDCGTQSVTAALIIDEAQNFDDDTFENLRLLSNFETFTSKLLQIVLVGQPELEAKLRRPSLRQVAERVAVHCHVNPLSWSESRKYVEYRLRLAGGSPHLFTRPALGLALRKSQGIPRRINIICHNALLFAYGEGAHRVSWSHVRAAVRAREGRGLITVDLAQDAAMRWSKAWLKPGWVAAGTVLATLAAVTLTWNYARPQLEVVAAHAPPVPQPMLPQAAAPLSQVPAIAAASLARATPMAVVREEASAGTDLTGWEAEEPTHTSAVEAPHSEVESALPASQSSGPPAAVVADVEIEHNPPAAASVVAITRPAFRSIRVGPGATLDALVIKVYGGLTEDLVRRVRLANPQIVDPDHILADDTLLFPQAEAVPAP